MGFYENIAALIVSFSRIFSSSPGTAVPTTPPVAVSDSFTSKRSFLKSMASILAGVASLGVLFGLGRFLSFNRGETRKREFSKNILENLQAGDPSHIQDADAWAVKSQGKEGIVYLDDRCTHLGCRYKWNTEKGVFLCPCHGSEFDLDGKMKHGPAVRDLTILEPQDIGETLVRLVKKF
jgi:Rieske Fe-S protein